MGRGRDMPAKLSMVFCSLLLCFFLPTQAYILPDHDSNGKEAMSWEAATIFLLYPVLIPPSEEKESTRVK